MSSRPKAWEMRSLNSVRLRTTNPVVKIRTGSDEGQGHHFAGTQAPVVKDLPLTEFEKSMQQLEHSDREFHAAEILSKLEDNYKLERESIYQSGYDAGMTAGKQELEAQYREDVRALELLIDEIRESRWRLRKDAELSLMQLVIQVAERVINNELQTNPSAIDSVLKEALSYVQENELVSITVNPEDYQYINEQSSLPDSLPEGIRIKQDSSLKRGGCILETNMETVDAKVGTKLEQIAAQLFTHLPDSEGE